VVRSSKSPSMTSPKCLVKNNCFIHIQSQNSCVKDSLYHYMGV